MGLTITDVAVAQSVGNYKEKIVDILFDSSYPTGGESITAGDCGLTELLAVAVAGPTGTVVRTLAWDRTNAKLLAYAPAGTEVANTTDLSAITVRAVVRGR